MTIKCTLEQTIRYTLVDGPDTLLQDGNLLFITKQYVATYFDTPEDQIMAIHH